jgi:zona occludens toxin (predicted ATPase)
MASAGERTTSATAAGATPTIMSSSQIAAAVTAAATPPTAATPASLLLHQCVARGDADRVARILATHIDDIDRHDGTGATPLMVGLCYHMRLSFVFFVTNSLIDSNA